METLPSLLKKATTYCHRYIRQRDEGKPCISCGNFYGQKDPGHFYKAELYSQLKFDENNINMQCRRCNGFEDGKFDGYTHGYLHRFGPFKLKKLQAKAEASKQLNFKWDREDLKAIIKHYKNKL